MKVEVIKGIICSTLGSLGTLITKEILNMRVDVRFLLYLMLIDIVAALMLAMVFKNSNKSETGKLSSNSMFKGLCKKAIVLMLIVACFQADLLLGVDYIGAASVLSFIAWEGISITEKLGLMGIKLPKVILDALDVITKKANVDK